MCILFLKKFFFIIFREGEGGRKRKKYQWVVASHVAPTGDLAHNPGMCPDWESNRRPFAFSAHTQSTELHLPGHVCIYSYVYRYNLCIQTHSKCVCACVYSAIFSRDGSLGPSFVDSIELDERNGVFDLNQLRLCL